jgi:hypothetical protein
MFAKLKKLIFGDPRPVVRSVNHAVIGTLTYSGDDAAWLTDPKTSTYGFGFYISGDLDADHPEIGPAAALVEHAAEIASRPDVFTERVRAFVESQLKTEKSLTADRNEIENLRVYRVLLMWPERPDDGEIELRESFDSERMWHCAYIGRQPARHLGFSGLDL